MDRSPKVPDDSKVRVPVKHDFGGTFYRYQFNGKTVGKSELHNLVTRLCKLNSHNFFDFLLYFHLFYTDGKYMDHPRLNGSTNPLFIRENNLKPISYPVKNLNTIFPVYKKNNVGRQKTPSLLST